MRRIHTWTPEEDQFVIDNYHVLGPGKIAEKMGISGDAVRCHAQGLGVKTKKYNTVPKEKAKPKPLVKEFSEELRNKFGFGDYLRNDTRIIG